MSRTQGLGTQVGMSLLWKDQPWRLVVEPPAASMMRKAFGKVCALPPGTLCWPPPRTHRLFILLHWGWAISQYPRSGRTLPVQPLAGEICTKTPERPSPIVSACRRPWCPQAKCVTSSTWDLGRGRQAAYSNSHWITWLFNRQATGTFCGDSSGPGLGNFNLMWSSYFVNIF